MAEGRGFLQRLPASESFRRLAHYALSIAAVWGYTHYGKEVQSACVPVGSLSSCQVASVIGLLLIGWFMVMTYRSAAWLRRCGDAVAVAIHPFMWTALMILPFVQYLVIAVAAWRLWEQVTEETADPVPPPAPEPEAPGWTPPNP